MGNEDKETGKKNKVKSKKYENHLSKVAYLQKSQLKQTDRHHQNYNRTSQQRTASIQEE